MHVTTQRLIPQRFHFVIPVVAFIFRRTIKGNEKILIVSMMLGVIGRILALVGFAVTLQAIVAAIHPEILIGLLNRVFTHFHINISIDAVNIVPVLIIAILVIFSAGWLIQYTRSYLIGILNLRITRYDQSLASQLTMDDDIFLLEQVPPVVEAVEKSCEILLFMLMVIAMIAYMAPMLSLLLIPMLGLLVSVQVFGDRSRLRNLHQQNMARKNYVNETRDNGALRKRDAPLDIEERVEYFTLRERMRHQRVVKPQADAFVGAVVISMVIYYLSIAEINSEHLAGVLIIFVVGIRNIISSGRELSVAISKILELRKDPKVLVTVSRHSVGRGH
jgi:hypothetical protein